VIRAMQNGMQPRCLPSIQSVSNCFSPRQRAAAFLKGFVKGFMLLKKPFWTYLALRMFKLEIEYTLFSTASMS
jgi:hypothetical protein